MPAIPEREPMVGLITTNHILKEDLKMMIGREAHKSGVRLGVASVHFDNIRNKPERYLDFLEHYNPSVLVVDIPADYKDNWEHVNYLMGLKQSAGRGFILASQNKPWLDYLVGKKTDTFELTENPPDLNQLAQLAQQVMRIYNHLDQPKDRIIPSSQSIIFISC